MSARSEYDAHRYLAEQAEAKAREADRLEAQAEQLHTRAADLRGDALELAA